MARRQFSYQRRRRSYRRTRKKQSSLLLFLLVALFLVGFLLSVPAHIYELLFLIVLSLLALILILWLGLRQLKRRRVIMNYTWRGPTPLSNAPFEFANRGAWTLDRLRTSMDATGFELFVGRLMQTLGYNDVVHSGQSGDLGADLRMKDANGNAIIVQCKHFAKTSIGTPDLQRFQGAMGHYGAVLGYFVTTSSFSQPAQRYAELYKQNLILIDGSYLLTIVRQQQHLL